MGFIDRDSFHVPGPDQPVWRYYPTSKFLAALQDGSLWFSRLDQFDDPFEGYGPLGNMASLTGPIEPPESISEHETVVRTDRSRSEVLEEYERLRQYVFVNCWSMGEEESAAMWKSFVPDGDGVAVRSTVGDLLASIERASTADFSANTVAYVEHWQEVIESDDRLAHLCCKPLAYEYEREFRLVLDRTAELLTHSSSDASGQSPSTQSGMPIEIEADTLISELRISPYAPDWVDENYWRRLLSEFELSVEPRQSKLSFSPRDVLEGDST